MTKGCSKCDAPVAIEEVFLVTGQVNGPRQTMTLLICEACGHQEPEEKINEKSTDISEGDRS